ncbi:flagellar hook-length control protein FliK [Sphingomonas sp. RS2018]
MIQLSSLPTPGPIDIGRPAASPLGTTSAFTLALAEMAVAGAAPAVIAPGVPMQSVSVPGVPGTMPTALPVADTVVATPALQDPAATGSDLPVAPAMPAVATPAPAGMTVAFDDLPTPAPAPIPDVVPVAFRPGKTVTAEPVPAGAKTSTRPALSDWTPDLPNVCPADLPSDSDTPVAPPSLTPEIAPATIAVAAPVAPVPVAPVETEAAPAPTAPVAGIDAAPAEDAAPIVPTPGGVAPSVPDKATRAIKPDAETSPRGATRHAARRTPADAVIGDDAAPSSSDTSDDPVPATADAAVPARTPFEVSPLPVQPATQVSPPPLAATPPAPQEAAVAAFVSDAPVVTVAPGRTPVPTAAPVMTAAPSRTPVPTEASVAMIQVADPAAAATDAAPPIAVAAGAVADGVPTAGTKAKAVSGTRGRPLSSLPATDAIVTPTLRPVRDARPTPAAAPFDVRPALTPGPALPQAQPATVDRLTIVAHATLPVASVQATTDSVFPTAARAQATTEAAPSAAAPSVTPAAAERLSSPDAPRVTVTVAAPAVAPTAPSIPQPAAQAFAAAMFAFAEDRREEPRADALLSDIAASLSLSGVGAPATAQPTPVALDARLPLVDTTRTDWMEKMIDRIETIQGESGKSETRIRLTPDALGNVDVAVTRDATGAIQLRMTSDNPHARTLLAEAAPRLAEMAEARGLKLGGSGVDSGAQGQGQGERRSETAAPRQPLRAGRTRTEDTGTTTDTRLA